MLYMNLRFQVKTCGIFIKTKNIWLTVEASQRVTLEELNRQPTTLKLTSKFTTLFLMIFTKMSMINFNENNTIKVKLQKINYS